MLGKDNKKLTPEESRQLKEKFKNRIDALSDEDLSIIAGGNPSNINTFKCSCGEEFLMGDTIRYAYHKLFECEG